MEIIDDVGLRNLVERGDPKLMPDPGELSRISLRALQQCGLVGLSDTPR